MYTSHSAPASFPTALTVGTTVGDGALCLRMVQGSCFISVCYVSPAPVPRHLGQAGTSLCGAETREADGCVLIGNRAGACSGPLSR